VKFTLTFRFLSPEEAAEEERMEREEEARKKREVVEVCLVFLVAIPLSIIGAIIVISLTSP
jgi:hypothetical protein